MSEVGSSGFALFTRKGIAKLTEAGVWGEVGDADERRAIRLDADEVDAWADAAVRLFLARCLFRDEGA
jgi:hypothetical protein